MEEDADIKSGEPCTVAGKYVTDCRCESRIDMAVGTYFPGCWSCGHRVGWRLIEGSS